MHEAAADSDLDLIALFNFDVNALLAKLVDTLGFSEEENLDAISLWVLVDVVGEVGVDSVHFVTNHDGLGLLHAILKVNHQFVDLFLCLLLCLLMFFLPLIILLF